MPFQIINQLFILRSEPIEIVSAGEPQYYICDTGVRSITLTPTVVGRPDNHAFEWELLSYTGNPLLPLPNMSAGSVFPVTPPNTFMYDMQFGLPPTFTSTFSAGDMVWRFYADRGTPFEQFKDITIFFTPTSFVAPSLTPPATANSPLTSISSALVSGKGRTVSFGSNENRKVTTLRPDTTIPTVPTVLGGKLTDKILTWTYSGDVDQFVDLTVFENLAGTFTQVAVITDSGNRYYGPAVIGGSYKAIVRQNDGILFGKSPYITSEQLGPIFVGPDAAFVNYAPTVVSLVQDQTKGQIRIDNFAIVVRTIKAFPVSNTVASLSLANQNIQNTSVRIDNFTILDLTGGAIGG